MYFATDLENKTIVNEDGDTFTVKQFQTILNAHIDADKTLDMTMMTTRLIRMDYDFEALQKFYDEN